MSFDPVGAIEIVGTHLKEITGFGPPSLETFGLELAQLGLLGRSFDPHEYARALERELEIRIIIEEFPDERFVLARQEVLREGTLAEVFYSERRREALVLIRESLRLRPWPAYELVLYHELSHLAAGHPARVQSRKVYEAEAKKRARWLVFSGNHPHVFMERVGANRIR